MSSEDIEGLEDICGDLDQYIRQQVKTTQSRLDQEDSETSSQGGDMLLDSLESATAPKSPSETDIELARYEDEVKCLEAEVAYLRDELLKRERAQLVSEDDIDAALEAITKRINQTTPRFNTATTAAAGSYDGAAAAGSYDGAAAAAACEDRHINICASSDTSDSVRATQLEREIKLNRGLTGLEFTSATRRIVRIDDNQLYRIQRHSGQCHGLTFFTAFTVLEEKGDECQTNDTHDNARIVDLNITIDQQAHKDLSSFVDRVKTSCDLMSFYRVFSKYSLFHFGRRQAFSKAQRQFPSLVSFPEGSGSERMALSSQTGLSVQLSWPIRVTEPDNQVEQFLRATVKRTSSVNSKEPSDLQLLIEQMARKRTPLYALHKLLALPIFTEE